MISIVCPFYNEEAILENALRKMLSCIANLPEPWELIIVNDGSTDNSLKIAEDNLSRHKNLKIVSYETNNGRGFALKSGIDFAKGDFIITTEMDCSWGDRVVHDLYTSLVDNPNFGIVIASTNLPNGGYNNVPFKRVAISRLGNWFLRLMVTRKITMFTGMTRGYRREVIQNIPISEYGKEFHLDVIAKAMAFGVSIGEIPAVLTWQDEKLMKSGSMKRKSSSKIPSLIKSHLVFGLSGRPFRYLAASAVTTLLATILFLVWGVHSYVTDQVSVHLLILTILSASFTVLTAGISLISLQQANILKELWIARRESYGDK